MTKQQRAEELLFYYGGEFLSALEEYITEHGSLPEEVKEMLGDIDKLSEK